MLGGIFRKAQNKIQDLAKLRRLIVDRMLPDAQSCGRGSVATYCFQSSSST